MASQAVTDRIHALFVRALSVEVPSPETDLIDGGLLDSLALVELLFELEREFGIVLSLDSLDIESLRTVDRIAELVETLARDAA